MVDQVFWSDLDDVRVGAIAAFVDVVVAGQAHRFEQTAKAAYAGGASRGDLLAAVDLGQQVGEVPAPVRAQAYAAIHAWHWMVARRILLRRELLPQAA